MAAEPRSRVELTDPRALRALAHPIRLKLVGLLRREGAMTSSQAGAQLGTSPASCSYHLRQLARWGLVEEAGGGRGRERPWRATASSTSWSILGPEMAEPAAAVGALVVRYQMERLLEALAALPELDERWQRAGLHADTVLALTPEQLGRLGERVLSAVEAVRSEAASAQEAPGERRRVGVFFAALPLPAEDG